MTTQTQPRIIQSPASWRGADIEKRNDWIHVLSSAEVAEIEGALASVKARGIGIAEVTKQNFPLPLFARVVEEGLEMLEHGIGMYLIRGLPVERHPVEDMRLVYWALGQHFGTAVTQSSKGDVLGDVKNMDIFNEGRGRGYQSRRKLEFHTDTCDVVGLLVLRTAKEGGLSKIASSIAVHNQMAEERPDLAEALYTVFYGYSPNERASSYWSQGFFTLQDGHFSCKTGHMYFRLAQEKFPELPRITPKQTEALEYFQDVANRPGMAFTMMFQPGDMQLLNNHVTLHARTEFEDWPEPDRRRHLLRLWLSVPNSRPLSPDMAGAFGDIRPGAVRGGYPAEPGKRIFESNVT